MYRFAFNHFLWNPTCEQFLQALRCISTPDQVKALRFAYQRDIKAFVAARLLTSYTIKLHFNMRSEHVDLHHSQYGRPFLPQHENFDFNISHNGDFTILAAEKGLKVGVDVMKLELPPLEVTVCKFLSKMKSILSVKELSYLNCFSSDEEKMRTFFRIWCLKEAYIKALGIGLLMDLSLIDFDLASTKIKCKVDGVLLDSWHFKEHTLPNNHNIAIALHSPDGNAFPIDKEFEILNSEELLNGVSPWNAAENSLWLDFIMKDRLPPSRRRAF